MKSLVPQKPQSISSRGLEVTQAFLQTGQRVSRSLLTEVNPRHTLLKVLIIPPMIAAILLVFVLMLVVLGFTLLAMALMWAIWRAKKSQLKRIR